MIQEFEIINQLSSILGDEAKIILNRNFRNSTLVPIQAKATQYPPSEPRFQLDSSESVTNGEITKNKTWFSTGTTIGVFVMAFLLISGLIITHDQRFIILKWAGIILGSIFGIVILIIGVAYLITLIQEKLRKSYKEKLLATSRNLLKEGDEVYSIITTSYESLSTFRVERERQAKTSYNMAITFISIGTILLFFGIILFFKSSITEGAISTIVGIIPNIIGGTILKFYNETNNRMDKLNDDLFVLNTTKIQYALILKIDDDEERNQQLGKLISNISSIKKS